jgi:hypothetical protein
MSALGHKQTFAVQNGMSALPPKPDIRHGDGDDLRRGMTAKRHCGSIFKPFDLGQRNLPP